MNHRGRIIATNTARRLVGTLWAPGARTTSAVDDPRLLWRVMIAG